MLILKGHLVEFMLELCLSGHSLVEDLPKTLAQVNHVPDLHLKPNASVKVRLGRLSKSNRRLNRFSNEGPAGT
ncbi:hypothetical protein FIU92_22750 (plasmid) [Ruegeria sp. THAF33]|nr:hypothetical protein FIU92_22750 [Ruegeria sp. THAF33]